MITLRIRQSKQSLFDGVILRKVRSQRCYFQTSGSTLRRLGILRRKVDAPHFAYLLVPEAEGDVLYAMRIGDTCYAVLAPSIRPGSCMVVGEIWNGSAMAHRPWAVS